MRIPTTEYRPRVELVILFKVNFESDFKAQEVSSTEECESEQQGRCAIFISEYCSPPASSFSNSSITCPVSKRWMCLPLRKRLPRPDGGVFFYSGRLIFCWRASPPLILTLPQCK